MAAMMSEASFLTSWRRRLADGQLGVVLVDVDHPLEVYAGVDDFGYPLVQIRSTVKPRLPELSDLVLVSRKESRGHWVLSLTLQDPRFAEVFLRLVAHVVSSSRDERTPAQAWVVVDAVLDEWRRLLRARPMGVLSLEELRGLVGELWLLLNRFAAQMSIDQAIVGWLGPLNAPQDFWYQKTGFHEAKSIGPTATHVSINSASQLDEMGMELLVLQVPQVSETESGSVNLVKLVDQAMAGLNAAGAPPDEFELRLRSMGVDITHSFYADTWFRTTAVETFVVTENFPALRQSDLPEGVEHVRYKIARSSIAPFLVKTDLIV
ncbi:PD-(D/E)XK motif protein [Kribbella sp. NPDC049174]|uniref:PD-(D/E)XK motif protein n=1 Tax=Kribbella sp. NPDC049174 TaxID=3364112 RepID=UPI003720AA5C